MLSYNTWLYIFSFVKSKMRNAFLMEQGQTRTCPNCCRDMSEIAVILTPIKDSNEQKMTCMSCGHTSYWFVGGPVSILSSADVAAQRLAKLKK